MCVKSLFVLFCSFSAACGQLDYLSSWLNGGDIKESVAMDTVSVTSNGEVMSHSDVSTEEWASLAGDDWCDWWNGSVTYDTAFCHHFAISRMPQSVMDAATERAIRCAAHYQTECVLSFEIGVSVPACFVYDRELGMRMITAPRVLDAEDEVSVRVENPNEETLGKVHSFNRTIVAEFLTGSSRRPVTETLTNASAWCVQLLRLGISPSCWKELD